MPSARLLHQLRQQLTPHQWRLLLKAGLCVGCQLALREVSNDEEIEAEEAGEFDDDEEDYGRPFAEEAE